MYEFILFCFSLFCFLRFPVSSRTIRRTGVHLKCSHMIYLVYDTHLVLQVVLSPTMWGDYTINDGGWTDTTMTISLVPRSSSEDANESKWAEVTGEDSSVDIKVVSIDLSLIHI